MSIDALARRLSQETREAVHGSLDVETRLGELHAVRRRRRVTGAAGLATAAALLAVTIGVLAPSGEDVARPAGSGPQPNWCPRSEVVECFDGSTVLVRAEVPYTFAAPSGLQNIDVSAAPDAIEIRATRPEGGGVTILTNVQSAGSTTIKGAGRLTRWVANREFLTTGVATRGTVDGLESYTLDARLAERGPAGSGICNVVQSTCRPVLEQPGRDDWQTGVSDGMVGRYSFVDVPGLGTVATWSWIRPQPGVPWSTTQSVLDRYETLVRSIDFQVS